MLYGIEGILNGKLFGNDEGGSGGGGITLPELTNPAGADQILEGFEAIDGSGKKVTGTHVCESGGGEDSNWVNYDKNGEKWIGETVDSDDCFSNTRITLSPTNQYRVTLDGVSQIVDNLNISNNDVASFTGGEFYGEFGDVCVLFDDGGSHAFKVESWIGEEPYVEDAGGGGKTGSLMVTGSGVVVPASSSTAVGSINAASVGPQANEGGYIPGTPILYICRKVNSNSGMSNMTYFNASASDYTLASGEYQTVITYTP